MDAERKNLLTKFTRVKARIDQIYKDKSINPFTKGKLMAREVIDEYNIKNPFKLSKFIKLIQIDEKNDQFTIFLGDLTNDKKDANKGEKYGELLAKEKKIRISRKISHIHFQRFTVAHEIAHIFIDAKPKSKGKGFSFQDDNYYRFSSGQSEFIYNDFAANLLVVDSVLKEDEFCDIMKTGNIKFISEAYQVPMKTLAILYERITGQEY